MKFQLLEEKELRDLSQFQNWARSLVKYLGPGTVFLLQGELGAGKTELIKTLLRKMGSKDVTSPTFALQQTYKIKTNADSGHQDIQLDHWDLYRIEDEDDLESSGFWDQFMTNDLCVWIEWPERFSWEALPRKAKVFLIEIQALVEVSGEGRKIKFSQRV